MTEKLIDMTESIGLKERNIAKCFVVIYTDNTGEEVTAYWSEDGARRAIEEEVKAIIELLICGGYEPEIIREDRWIYEFIAKDTNMYYQWWIVETTIE